MSKLQVMKSLRMIGNDNYLSTNIVKRSRMVRNEIRLEGLPGEVTI